MDVELLAADAIARLTQELHESETLRISVRDCHDNEKDELLVRHLKKCVDAVVQKQFREFKKRSLESELGGTFFPIDVQPTPLATLLDKEDRAYLLRCMNQLPPPLYDVMHAMIIDKLNGKETAAKLEITNAAVSQRKSKAIEALRRCLQEHLES